MKRLCFVSSEAGSITVAHRKDGYAYCMSKASLNMAVKLMFNELRPQGYTFRLYHPGWVNSYMGGDQKGTSGKYERRTPHVRRFSSLPKTAPGRMPWY